jgi:hypothetical protein
MWQNFNVAEEIYFRNTETKITTLSIMSLGDYHSQHYICTPQGVKFNEEGVQCDAYILFLFRYGAFHESYEEKVLKKNKLCKLYSIH